MADWLELPAQLEQSRDSARAPLLAPTLFHCLANESRQQRALVRSRECLVEGGSHVVGDAEVQGRQV
jgi:hypothetical protein